MRSRGLLTVAIALATASAAAARIAVVGPGGGGDIECVIASRHDSARILAGCDVGGFYFSSDFGRHWEIRNVGLGCPGVQTIAEHPKDPNRLAIGGHAGILLSDDLGLHWHQASNGLPAPSPDGHSAPVVKIVWDENDTNRLWAATGLPHDGKERSRVAGTRGRVYRSDDGGESWRMVVADNGWGDDSEPVEIFDLCQLRSNSLVAATSRGLFRSDDAGVHWRPIGVGLPCSFDARHLAVAPSSPSRIYLALRETAPAPFPREASVWRSDDGGETWGKTAPLPDFQRMSDGREAMDAWGRMAIAVSPHDPDEVWLGGVWYREGLCHSRDGGETWEAPLRKVPHGWVGDFWSSPVVSLDVSRAFPSNIVFGTMSGIHASEDAGATWAQRYTAEDLPPGKIAGTGLDTLCVADIRPDRFVPNRIRVAFYDVGLMQTDDSGRTWRRCMAGVPRGLAGICWTLAQSPLDPERIWAFFGTWGGGGRSVPARSDDGGETWIPLADAAGWPGGVARDLQALRVRAASAPAGVMLAAVCDGKGIFLSADGGVSWRGADTKAFPDSLRVGALASADGVLYAGTHGFHDAPPRLWRSDDGGETWEAIGEFASSVSAIAVDGAHIAVAVRCTGPDGGCFLSDDDGATWSLIYREAPWNDLTAVAFAKGRVALASRSARWHDPGFGGEGLLLIDPSAPFACAHVKGGGLDKPEIMSLVADPFVPGRLWFGTWGNSAGIVDLGELEGEIE